MLLHQIKGKTNYPFIRQKYMVKPIGIKWFKEYALRRGGLCLSDDYRSVKSRLKFRCRNNHEWETVGHSVRYGSWCPKCHHIRIADLQRDNHGFYAALARDRRGQLLSGTYENSNTRMQFQCSNGHTFENRAANIKRGQWCPKCASTKRGIKRRDSIELFQELANSKGGVCHTGAYTDQDTLLEMECARGHRWFAQAKRIKRGDWCMKCSGNERRDIQDFRDLVEARGGKLLSSHYEGAHTPLRIECNIGHQFTISFPNARNGKWCPYCKTRIGESMCRLAFETVFRERFPMSHPKWLTNPKTRKPLQLDGYCEKLKLAFEHQGQQHNKAVERFGGQDGFRSLQLRDRFKSEKCKDHGVLLVCIDELFTTIQPAEIRSEIIRVCKENGFTLPPDVDSVPIDYSKVYKQNIKERYVAEVKEFLAKNHEGSVLLTDEIVRCNSGVTVRCAIGHVFATNRYHLFRGDWCPTCSGKVYGEKNYHTLGEKYRLKFIPPMPKGKNLKATWECPNGHLFQRSYSLVARGQYRCMECIKVHGRLYYRQEV